MKVKPMLIYLMAASFALSCLIVPLILLQCVLDFLSHGLRGNWGWMVVNGLFVLLFLWLTLFKVDQVKEIWQAWKAARS